MRTLKHPAWWALGVFILWGVVGKLDEPLEGFDPEPAAPAAVPRGRPAAGPFYLLCELDEVEPEPTARARELHQVSYRRGRRSVAAGLGDKRLLCIALGEPL